MQKISVRKSVIADVLDQTSRKTAVLAIAGYQKFISPHKGFSCAHRVLYGCESCSQYFKRVVGEDGIFTAIANAKGRFQECREANQILQERRARCRALKNNARRKYYATRDLVFNNSEDLEIPEDSQDSNETDTSQESTPSESKKLGGSQWSQKRRSQASQNNQANNNNCNNCDVPDCSDCVEVLNILPNDCGDKNNCDHPFEAMNCGDLNCPDLNCGDADCLSGMDCSGLDCGGLDCGGCG